MLNTDKSNRQSPQHTMDQWNPDIHAVSSPGLLQGFGLSFTRSCCSEKPKHLKRREHTPGTCLECEGILGKKWFWCGFLGHMTIIIWLGSLFYVNNGSLGGWRRLSGLVKCTLTWAHEDDKVVLLDVDTAKPELVWNVWKNFAYLVLFLWLKI